jgi:predicted esterase
MYIYNLLNVLYNTIYSLIFYKKKTVLQILDYSIDNESKYIENKDIYENTTPTIYYTRLPEVYDTKILVYLSGSVEFKFTSYIDKTIVNMEKYNIPSFIYENEKKLMFVCVEDITNFIKFLYKKYIDKEIIIIGFSAGGILASHVIYNLKDLKDFRNIKKFITYDTPLSLDKCLKTFINSYFRFDILIAYYLEKIYKKLFKNISNKFNYSFIDGHNYIYDTSKIVLSPYTTFFNIMNMNFNLPYYIKMYNICSIKDPISDYYTNMKIINKNKNLIDFQMFILDNKEISHCTDMFFNDNSELIIKCIND